jgi:hypothetical protein
MQLQAPPVGAQYVIGQGHGPPFQQGIAVPAEPFHGQAMVGFAATPASTPAPGPVLPMAGLPASPPRPRAQVVIPTMAQPVLVQPGPSQAPTPFVDSTARPLVPEDPQATAAIPTPRAIELGTGHGRRQESPEIPRAPMESRRRNSSQEGRRSRADSRAVSRAGSTQGPPTDMLSITAPTGHEDEDVSVMTESAQTQTSTRSKNRRLERRPYTERMDSLEILNVPEGDDEVKLFNRQFECITNPRSGGLMWAVNRFRRAPLPASDRRERTDANRPHRGLHNLSNATFSTR